jgi:hypothetical protein
MPTEAEGFTDVGSPGEAGSVVGQDGHQFDGGAAAGTVSVTGTGLRKLPLT